jgi:hypothetical protein
MAEQNVPIYQMEPPTQAQLEMKARDAIKSDKANRKMSKEEIQKQAEEMAKSTIAYAESMGGGPQAWQTAIRQEIYGSETD